MKNPTPLRLSKTLSLPLDAVTQTFAILAKKRRGKTYTASVLAEEMIKAKLPFVVLDPTSAWWGLRASADGKKAGYPVVIIGGDHGDIPLESTAGHVIADLVVEHPGYYIIDMGQTNSNAEQDRFAMDFGERLYRAKAKRRFPMHLYVDEADCFIPQQPMPDQRRLLGAYDTIVRRGGIRGLGVTLISQRPAVVNKNVLSQVECLVVLQILGKHDRDAIESWVRQHGAKEDCDALMGSLASLGLGEAWFWSPAWLDIIQRVQIRERETFNSSKTPELGDEHIQPAVLAKVDLDAIRERVADTIERAKNTDPQALHQRIAKLQRELAQAQKTQAPAPAKTGGPATKIERITVPIVGKKAIVGIQAAAKDINKSLAKSREVHKGWGATLVTIERRVDDLTKALERVTSAQSESPPVVAPAVAPTTREVTFQPTPGAVGYRIEKRSAVGPTVPFASRPLGKCERAILATLALHMMDGCNSRKLALLAGYSWSGTFSNAVGALRMAGYLAGTNQEAMRITAEGLGALGEHEPLPTHGEGIRSYWRTKFGKCERQILDALFNNPHGLNKEKLCELTGYSWSGTFSNAVGALRTAGCLVGPNTGVMRASEELLI